MIFSFLNVVSIKNDCDNDTLLLKVEQIGVACHTGRKSCFFTDLETNESISEVEVNTTSSYGVIDTLFHVIESRKNDDPETSYTAKLLKGKQNSMLKKVVEEAGEFSFAVKDNDTEEIIYEEVHNKPPKATSTSKEINNKEILKKDDEVKIVESTEFKNLPKGFKFEIQVPLVQD